MAASREMAIDTQERSQRSVSSLELGLVEMPTRPHSAYTMGQRKAAIEEADQGLLRAASDITLAAITEDAYCRGILADLTQGMWGLRKHFTGHPDIIAALDDTPERVGQFREMFPDADSIRLMSWGVSLGVAPGQMRRKYGARPGDAYPISPDEAANWKATKAANPLRERPIGTYDTRILRAWSPKWLRCQWWDGPSWFLMTADGEIRISQLDDPPGPNVDRDAMGRPIKRGNPDEWIIYTPYGEVEPWQWGTWKSATLAFVAARDATFDRLRHSEVLAPVRVGMVPAGTTETQRKRYADQLARAKRMALYVLPPGLDYKVVESTGRVTDVYKAIIEWAERQYAMQSGVLTTATGNAGFAKGDVQERYSRAILSFLANSLATCFWKPTCAWSREEFDTEDAPRVGWDTEAPEDKKARAETVKLAGEALEALADAAERHGYAISDASFVKYTQSLGFEMEKLPEKTNAPKIDVTPTAREYAYTLGEVRASDGYGPMGEAIDGDRNTMTVADAEQLAKKKAMAAPSPSVGAAPAIPGSPVVEESVEPPSNESAAQLAQAMTEHVPPVDRCEHGHPNICRTCGIERERVLIPGVGGGPHSWGIRWQPILRPRPIAAEVV